MPAWKPFSDWMAFPYLDEFEGLARSFTIAYKITDDSAELWSGRFNRFKQKEKRAIFGAAAVLKDAVPALMANLKLDLAQTVLIPALSSSESTATVGGILSAIVRQCAQLSGGQFKFDSIRKKPHRPIHNIYSAAKRDTVLDDDSENSSGSNRQDRPNGSCRSMLPSTTPSTSNAIF